MVNVFIVHGSYGNPNENWIPWLKNELEKLGCDVYAPTFPTPKNQLLKSWLKVFEDYSLDGNSIVIGHSVGVGFLLNVLENIGLKIKSAFFISGFARLYGDPKFDKITKTFVDKKFNWDKIKNNCGKFVVFHSDNDHYVDIRYGKEVADKLDAEFVLVKGGGHFNTEAGYGKFELLLEKIKTYSF